MSRTTISSWRRAGLAAFAAVVLSGAGAAAALVSDDTPAPAQGINAPGQTTVRNTGGVPEPALLGHGTQVAQSPPSTGLGKDIASRSSSPDASLYAGGCPAPLPGVVTGGKVDPALGGFPMRLLGGDFTLAGLAIAAERTCYDTENPDRVVRTLNTTWLHAPSRLSVFVSQREQSEPIANVITSYYAQFWADGFAFTVSASPMGGDVTIQGEPDKPVRAPGGADTIPVLEAALRQLAPGLDQACFAREILGDWADLAAIGVGDPRPALPRGFNEIWKEIVRVTAPAASCNAVKADGALQERVNLNFANDAGSFIAVSAYAAGGNAEPATGQFNPGYANWSNGKLFFNLNWDPGTVDDATARKIAIAVDPGFADVCFVTQRELTALEYGALGLKEPRAPEGFSLQPGRNAVRVEATGPCKDAIQGGGFNVSWFMNGDEGNRNGFIQAGAWGGPQSPGMNYFPYIEGSSLYWKDARGYFYYVSSFKAEVPADRDTLIAVAKSMDPNFNESQLLDPPEGMDPIPMPADSSGGGTTGAVPPSTPVQEKK